MKRKTIFKFLNQFLYVISAATLIAGAFLTTFSSPVSADSGAIWTTSGSCGLPQNVNHYAVGEPIYINYSNFTPGLVATWQIQDPGTNGTIIVGSSDPVTNTYGSFGGFTVTVDSTGAGCFLAFTFTIPGGPYQTKFGGVTKNDNFSIDAASTATTVPPTATTVPPTETSVPPTETSVPPTETSVPPTATTVPPTETSVPPTETSVPPTETSVPPTATTVPPTATTVPPTETSVPPTGTAVPPTDTPEGPTNTPSNPTPPPALKLALIDPYCNPNGTVQWTVENPGSTNVTVLYWWLDGGGHQSGFTAAPGSTKFTTTTVGTHTVNVVYGESQLVSLTFTIDSCSIHIVTPVVPTITPTPTTAPLPIPNTGGGGLLIPVTGADQTQNLGANLLFSGIALLGIAIMLSELRKKYSL